MEGTAVNAEQKKDVLGLLVESVGIAAPPPVLPLKSEPEMTPERRTVMAAFAQARQELLPELRNIGLLLPRGKARKLVEDLAPEVLVDVNLDARTFTPTFDPGGPVGPEAVANALNADEIVVAGRLWIESQQIHSVDGELKILYIELEDGRFLRYYFHWPQDELYSHPWFECRFVDEFFVAACYVRDLAASEAEQGKQSQTAH